MDNYMKIEKTLSKSICFFDLGNEPEDFDPDYLKDERIRDKRHRTWRAEVYENVVEGDESVDVMAYHGYDVYPREIYIKNRRISIAGLGGVLSFGYQESEEAEYSSNVQNTDGMICREVIFVKDFVLPKKYCWRWTEEDIYAYIVSDVRGKEPFFLSLTCYQPPPSQRAAIIIKENLNAMYNPWLDIPGYCAVE